MTGQIITKNERVLVTGANGFIGSYVVRALLSGGFRRVRCLIRSAANVKSIEDLQREFPALEVEIVTGNLLSVQTCAAAAEGVSVVYHLAAGVDKSFAGCVLNSVVTTRNLMEAFTRVPTLKRFVNIGSFAVYSNKKIRRGGLLDESCEVDDELVERFDPYAYGKARQDEIVREYGREKNLPFVLVRPSVTFGPGKTKIPGRVGIDTFGVFLHLGLGNRMPFTYVENCADAIVLAGLAPDIEGEVINIVDDDVPSSRQFLRGYKRHVRRFVSIPVPYWLFYLFNWTWETYSRRSGGQVPPSFNRRTCTAYFKGNTYSNEKAKRMLGWRPRVGMSEALDRYYSFAHKATIPQ